MKSFRIEAQLSVSAEHVSGIRTLYAALTIGTRTLWIQRWPTVYRNGSSRPFWTFGLRHLWINEEGKVQNVG